MQDGQMVASESTAGSLEPGSRQARAERILDATAELLLRWGYDRITIDDVADQARVGKGTIYLHWKTREALFYAVLLREGVVITDDLLAAVRRDPRGALLHRITRATYVATMRQPLVRAVVMEDAEMLGKLIRNGITAAIVAQKDRALLDYLTLLAQHGLLRADLSVPDLFYAYKSAATGFMLTQPYIDERYRPALERQGDLLADIVRLAFEPAGTPPDAAVRAVADRMIALFAAVADASRAELRLAYA